MTQYIYLDTCHLQRISERQYRIIFNKLQAQELVLVYSRANLIEMAARDDQKKYEALCKILDRFKIVFLRNPEFLIKLDIFKANNIPTPNTFFSEKISDLLYFNNLPQILIATPTKTQKLSEFLIEIYHTSSREKIITDKKMEDYINANVKKFINSQVAEKAIFESAETKFDEKITALCLSENFIKSSRPNHSLSFLICFVAQMLKIINKKDKLCKNDLLDAEHCLSIPYVNYFMTDKGNACDIRNAIKKIEEKYSDFKINELKVLHDPKYLED